MSILTVTTPRADLKLVSLTDLKAELEITGTASDTYLGSLLDRVSQMVEAHCDRVFAVETVREDFREDCGLLYLPLTRYPVIGVSAVTVDGEALVGDIADLVEIDKEKGRLYRMDSSADLIQWETGRISITYQAGYSVMPGNLREAVMRLAKYGNSGRTRDPAIKGERFLEGLYAYDLFNASSESSGGMPTDVAGLLAPYLRYSV